MSVSGRRPNVVEDALLALGETRILAIPSLDGPREGHWLHYWDDLPNLRRVDLPYWSYPRRDAWMDVLGEAISTSDRVLIVASGLGCAALAIWATLARPGALIARIGGALLVSPVDPGDEGADPRCAEFRPLPSLRLPFPSLLVGNGDDARLPALARLWGCRRADPGSHREPPFGPWPEGLGLLATLAGFAAEDRRLEAAPIPVPA